MKTIAELKQEFENSTLFKLFEIKVINKETKEKDYIIFDISIQNDYLIAQHVGLTIKEEQSNKIAFKEWYLDNYLTLDTNLSALYDVCINAILESDFFTLAE